MWVWGFYAYGIHERNGGLVIARSLDALGVCERTTGIKEYEKWQVHRKKV